jgi:Flp pilus assembly protein TadG
MFRHTIRLAHFSHRGTVAAVVAITLPVFIGVAALALDGGILLVQRRQAQSAADGAALSGAYALSNGSTFSTAQSAAIAIGSQKQITISAADVTEPQAGSISVSVTSTQPRMFSALWGSGTMAAKASATAVAQTSLSGFQANGSLSARLLPIVLDVTTWQTMMAGQSSDQYTYNAASNTVTAGPDGITESQLYPVASGSPGNWGTIKVGVSNNSTSVLSAQITNGITPTQLATFPNSTIQLDTTLSPPSITFPGNPGISAGIKSALTSIIGQPVAVPIYDLNGGNGSNAWYRVIAFQPARIMSVNFQGNPKYVIIQPAILNDPTGIGGAPQDWSAGGLLSLQITR